MYVCVSKNEINATNLNKKLTKTLYHLLHTCLCVSELKTAPKRTFIKKNFMLKIYITQVPAFVTRHLQSYFKDFFEKGLM